MCAVPTVAPDQVTFSTMSSASSASAIVCRPSARSMCARRVRHRHAPRDQRAMPAMRTTARTSAAGSKTWVYGPDTGRCPAARRRRWRRRARASSAELAACSTSHAHARPLAAERRAGRQHRRASAARSSEAASGRSPSSLPDRRGTPRRDARPSGDRPPHHRASAPAHRRGTRPSPDAAPQPTPGARL